MIKTEIQLTEQEYAELERVAAFLGHDKGKVLHDAFVAYVDLERVERRRRRFKAAFGMWKDRTDIPDYRKDRDEGSRY